MWSPRFSQETPRSVERKTPPALFAASTIAYTVSGADGATARPMRPSSSFGSPASILFQVAPASVER